MKLTEKQLRKLIVEVIKEADSVPMKWPQSNDADSTLPEYEDAIKAAATSLVKLEALFQKNKNLYQAYTVVKNYLDQVG